MDLVSQFVGFYGVPDDFGSREIAQNPDHGDQELDLVVFEALLLRSGLGRREISILGEPTDVVADHPQDGRKVIHVQSCFHGLLWSSRQSRKVFAEKF